MEFDDVSEFMGQTENVINKSVMQQEEGKKF